MTRKKIYDELHDNGEFNKLSTSEIYKRIGITDNLSEKDIEDELFYNYRLGIESSRAHRNCPIC